MKSTANTFVFLGVFTAVVGFVYGFLTDFQELAGFPAMLAVAALCFMIAVYLYLVLRSAKGILPEDKNDGEIIESAGDYGHFSPWSWWPLVLGTACTLAFLSLAIDWWIMGLAAPLAVIALVGFVYEYSRGDHAH